MCLTSQILKSQEVFWYSLAWGGCYFSMLESRNQFSIGMNPWSQKPSRQAFQKLLSGFFSKLLRSSSGGAVSVCAWPEAELQALCRLAELALSAEGQLGERDASHRRWLGWKSPTGLCSMVSAAWMQPLPWGPQRQEVFLEWRGA